MMYSSIHHLELDPSRTSQVAMNAMMGVLVQTKGNGWELNCALWFQSPTSHVSLSGHHLDLFICHGLKDSHTRDSIVVCCCFLPTTACSAAPSYPPNPPFSKAS